LEGNRRQILSGSAESRSCDRIDERSEVGARDADARWPARDKMLTWEFRDRLLCVEDRNHIGA
jgi:hypothetical protein